MFSFQPTSTNALAHHALRVPATTTLTRTPVHVTRGTKEPNVPVSFPGTPLICQNLPKLLHNILLHFFAVYTSIFTSPNYPSVYLNNYDYTWTLSVSSGTVHVQVNSFHLEAPNTCPYDWVKVGQILINILIYFY